MPFDAPASFDDTTSLAERAAAKLWAEAAEHDRPDADLNRLLAPLRPLARTAAPLATMPEAAPVLARVLRAIGGANLSAGRLFEGHVNALKLVHRYATAEVWRAFAQEAEAGAWSGVWNAEAPPGLRIDAAGRLEGAKIYASGAGFLHRPLVTARDRDGRLHMLLIRDVGGRRVDLSAWLPAGMRATATGTVDLTGVQAAAYDRIGGADDYWRAPVFKGGAWRFLAVQLGAMERLEALTAQHLRARGRTGDPHQRARFGRAAAAVETARLWVDAACRRAEDPDADPDAAEAYVNLARGAVERAALDLLQLVERSVGLEARLAPNPIERVSRDLATYLRQPFPDGAEDAAAAYRLEEPGA